MKKITVYADFDFLVSTQEIGTLGWTLAPAYDINLGAKTHQCLLIDQYTEQSDINVLLQASGSYMLEQQEAAAIIEEVRTTIKDWRKTATELQISLKTLESYSMRWDNL